MEIRWIPFPIVILVSLQVLVIGGCATTSAGHKSNGEITYEHQSHEVYHLAALDQVSYVSDDGKHTAKINLEGNLELDAAHLIAVMGLTIPEAEKKLREALPHVKQIQWIEFHENSVSVLGEVYNQTKVDLGDAPMRVLDAVAAAGGFTPLSDASQVVLVRRNAGELQIFKLNLRGAMNGEAPQFNILLMPGDVITVPRSLL